MLIEAILSLLILVGSAFVLIGSIGLVRLPDFFTRLHAPTKATTLGLGCVLLASIGWFSRDGDLSLHEGLITLFLFLSAPVSAHLLAKAAIHLGLKPWTGTPLAAGDCEPRNAPSGEPD